MGGVCQSVCLYYVSKYSLFQKFIGNGQRQSTNEWDKKKREMPMPMPS